MAIVEIPLRSDLDRYSVIAAINGTDYRFSVSFNTRDDHWYISIELTDGTELAAGLPIVSNQPLLARWRWDSRLPQDGFLMAVDSSGEDIEPEKEDLGDRVKLLWIPYEDIT